MDKEYVNRLITTGLVDKAMSFGLNKHCIANSNIAVEIVVDNSNIWHTSKKSSLLNTIDLVKSRHIDDGENKCISDTVLYWLNDIEEKHKNNLLIDKETAETFFDSIEQLQFRVEAISYDIITQKVPLDIRVTKEMLLSDIESIKVFQADHAPQQVTLQVAGEEKVEPLKKAVQSLPSSTELILFPDLELALSPEIKYPLSVLFILRIWSSPLPP